MKYILTINAGSSSLKFSLFDLEFNEIMNGLFERIGIDGKIKYKHNQVKNEFDFNMSNHEIAVKKLIDILEYHNIKADEVSAIAHRMVHGGPKFFDPVVLDENILNELEKTYQFAPLHNPNNVMGMKVAMKMFDAPNVVVFDTGFHKTIPKLNYHYAIPNVLVDKYGLRKYGFHGTSHQYINEELKKLKSTGKISGNKFIICHLGNGSSISAIKDGICIDNSMGFTPVDGMVMGTRCGNIDPSVITFLTQHGFNSEEINTMLNKKSGLLSLANSSDLREIYTKAKKIERANDTFGDEEDTNLFAIKYLAHRAVKIIGSYVAQMSGVDAIVFTAGIGENAWYLRRLILKKFGFLGFIIDEESNKNNSFCITSEDSLSKAIVIPTNEELMMAKIAKDFLN